MHSAKMALVVAVALMVAAAGPVVPAAAQIPACVTNLIGCANYLNATTAPPSTCCNPLNTAVKKDLPCLCSLVNSTLLVTFNVSITQALHVAKLCGSDVDPKTACAAVSKSGNGTSTPPAATPPTSSSNTSGSPATKSNNSAHGLTSIGFPGLLSLLLFSGWSLFV